MTSAETLISHPIFDSADRERLLPALSAIVPGVRSFSPGQVLMLQGDRHVDLSILEAGTISATIDSPDGKSLLMETLVPPSVLAPALFFAKDPALPVTLTAATAGRLVTLKRDAVIALAREFPSVYEEILRLVSEKFVFLTTRMRLLHFRSLRARVSGYVLERLGQSSIPEVVLPYDRERLAELMGVARPSLSRAIGQLSSEGLIATRGRRITVLDEPGLRRIAELE